MEFNPAFEELKYLWCILHHFGGRGGCVRRAISGETDNVMVSFFKYVVIFQPNFSYHGYFLCRSKTSDLIETFLVVLEMKQGIKGWYWPQGLLSTPINNIHKSWATRSDMTSVSSASKSEFLTSSLVIPGQCNFSCSREERKKASSRRLKTENFG